MTRSLLFIFCCIVFWQCTDDPSPVSPETGVNITDWLIPVDEVLDGGVGKDGIPSIDQPQFDKVEEVNPAFDDELVVGLEINGVIQGFPIPILDWHEIVNHKISDIDIAITYCPLTGTAIGWGRKIGTTVSTFGVSGFLFNSNLMPYDRRTNSLWSQQRLECVNGPRIGTKPATYSLIETTLSTWRASFPGSEIMNANTGFDRRYSFYPYGDYRRNNDRLLFPVAVQDDRLPQKERVLGVIHDDNARIYRMNNPGEGIDVIHDQFEDIDLIVARSADLNFNSAWLNPGGKTFQPVQDALPVIVEDDTGNKYDLAGRIIEGPNSGQKLEKPTSFIGFWFSWPSFYENLEIYNES